MKRMRYIVLVGIVVFLASCARKESAKTDTQTGASRKAPVAVEAVRVTRGVLSRKIEASGIVQGSREAEIVSETQGVIREVSFELGNRVSQGVILARVDDRVQKLEMESAKQSFDNATIEFDAASKLQAGGGASQLELNRLQVAVAAAKTRYEAALKAYEDCALRAPISGFIAAREASLSPGNFLTRGTRVARIVDLSTLRVTIAVGEREVGLIMEGSPATIRIASGCDPNQFRGKVRAVAAGAQPGSGSFAVVVEWQNTCGASVRSGMTASVVIPSAGQDTVILVPSAAIVKRDGRDAVLVAAGDRTVVRPILVGRVVGNRTHIIQGIEEAETVIMSSLGTLGPNDPVTVTVIGESGVWM